MSSLLEKAIIDAKALKESALKNAENLVIEKYSSEVKEAMARLLEVEADPLAAGGDMGLGMDSPTDLGMGEDPMLDATTEDPAQTANPEATIDPESISADLPDAFGSPTDDDQVVRIKLDALEAEFDDDIGLFGGDDKIDDGEITIDIGNLELDSAESNLDAEEEVAFDAEEDTDDEIGIDMVAEDNGDEEIDVDELLEKLRIDFEPQKSGWAGTPEPIMREYEDQLLAHEQDTEIKEEAEELRKTVADLTKENKLLSSAANKLQAQNERYVNALETLQEKLEQSNVSNAKLLYINQALENTSLNERQKRKIVEAISKADSVNEAKIVYDTLQETIGTARAAQKVTSSLNEAVNKRSSLLMAARRQKNTEDTANPMFDRMKRLAGIKDK